MDFSNKICLGIISYIPDDNSRELRLNKIKNTLNNLINFNLSIIIIAQNWKDEIKPKENWIIFNYDKLGITKARITLREKFLESNFEYMIMLDDDIEFEIINPNLFIKTIISHPNGWSHLGHTIQIAAISKNIYKQVEFPNVDVQRDHIFEDAVFLALLKEYFKENEYKLDNCGIKYNYLKNSTGNTVDTSTWFNGDCKYMTECWNNTSKYILENIKNKNKSTTKKTYVSNGYFNL